MNCPMIMQGSTLIYEEGDDLEDDVAGSYALNVEKVLELFVFLLAVFILLTIIICLMNCVVFLPLQVFAQLPAPITSGTSLIVEDLQQELSCNINVKHRFVPSVYYLVYSFKNDNSVHDDSFLI